MEYIPGAQWEDSDYGSSMALKGWSFEKKIKGEREKIKKWGFSGIKGTVRGRSKVFEAIFGHCPIILIL